MTIPKLDDLTPPLNILLVHNRYLLAGGEDNVFSAEKALLIQHGNQVDEYIEDNQRIAKLGKLRTAARSIWSAETYQSIRNAVAVEKYDIVHVHNFYPLVSPAIHYAAQAENVPVVQTLHNFRLLCSNALFFRDNQICEDCLNHTLPLPGIRHACYRGSTIQTVSIGATFTAHRLARTWQKKVDLFIALSQFARSKFIEGGLPAERIVVKPNFLASDPGVSDGAQSGKPYVLFVGRLSAEKGIDTLLSAWQSHPDLPLLKIVGDGPLAPAVRQLADTSSTVQWLGRLPHTDILPLMQQAQFIILPSLCYENFPLVLVEAFACARPVMVSKLGSLQELVTDGYNGLHFNAGDATDLASKVAALSTSPQQIFAMGQNARTEYEQKYTAERNYLQLRDIYQQAGAAVKQK